MSPNLMADLSMGKSAVLKVWLFVATTRGLAVAPWLSSFRRGGTGSAAQFVGVAVVGSGVAENR